MLLNGSLSCVPATQCTRIIDPAVAAEDRTLHAGRVPWCCLVIAETSCEARNLFLDATTLLVDTVGPSGAAFF